MQNGKTEKRSEEHMNEVHKVDLDSRFTNSLTLVNHPVAQKSSRFRNDYFQMLSHLLAEELSNEITFQRLMQYRLFLTGTAATDPSHKFIRSMPKAISRRIWIGKGNYVLYLLLDAALILDNPEKTGHVYEYMCRNLYGINRTILETVYQALLDQNLNPVLDPYAKNQLIQFRENQAHKQKQLFRVAVAATVSAGKSEPMKKSL